MDLKGNVFIEGPAGRLEGIIKEPEGEVVRAAVVCHPHPLFGGTMHNKVVFRIARAFIDEGFAVLRFNFRGVGQSEGVHDEGRGEENDLRSAVRFLQEQYPAASIWGAGFSFGAAVLLRVVCSEPLVRGFVAAGLPISKYDFSALAGCEMPKLFIQGSLDEFGSAADLERFFGTLKEPRRLKIIEGADHFFVNNLREVQAEVSAFIRSVS